MANIIELKSKITKDFYKPLPIKYEIVKTLYYSLLNSGYSTCQAFHESIKLFTIINPNIKLSQVSQKTFDIIYPKYDTYY